MPSDKIMPQASPCALSHQVEGETIVFLQGQTEAHCLGENATLVWQHCDGTTSRAKVREMLTPLVGPEEAKAVLEQSLQQLQELGLLVPGAALDDQPPSPGRRTLLKAAGLAPLIATVGLPQPAAAQSPPSGCVPNSVCSGTIFNPPNVPCNTPCCDGGRCRRGGFFGLFIFCQNGGFC